jgi:hypothetical protein
VVLGDVFIEIEKLSVILRRPYYVVIWGVLQPDQVFGYGFGVGWENRDSVNKVIPKLEFRLGSITTNI